MYRDGRQILTDRISYTPLNKNREIETDRTMWAINLENQNRAVNSLTRHGEQPVVK